MKKAKKKVVKKAKKKRERLTDDQKENLRDYLRDAALKPKEISGYTDIPVPVVRYWMRKWKMPRVQIP